MAKNRTSHSRGSKSIVSYYVNGETPSEENLNHIIETMQATGADIIKLVTKAADITEIPRIFHLFSCCQVRVLVLFFTLILINNIDSYLMHSSLEFLEKEKNEKEKES